MPSLPGSSAPALFGLPSLLELFLREIARFLLALFLGRFSNGFLHALAIAAIGFSISLALVLVRHRCLLVVTRSEPMQVRCQDEAQPIHADRLA
jgi:hypothetical protein